jgi:hypothetical protein
MPENEEKVNSDEPINTPDTGRNPDGTWKKGFCPNPKGRKKNPLKEYSLKEFLNWTDEEKKAFLDKIPPIDRWKMTEGNPQNDITSDGEQITVPIYCGLSRHKRNEEDIQPNEED